MGVGAGGRGGQRAEHPPPPPPRDKPRTILPRRKLHRGAHVTRAERGLGHRVHVDARVGGVRLDRLEGEVFVEGEKGHFGLLRGWGWCREGRGGVGVPGRLPTWGGRTCVSPLFLRTGGAPCQRKEGGTAARVRGVGDKGGLPVGLGAGFCVGGGGELSERTCGYGPAPHLARRGQRDARHAAHAGRIFECVCRCVGLSPSRRTLEALPARRAIF